MLKRLTIKNVALIGEAELEFSDGLNVLTGETGAGKSVILDSIDFVLGAKADKGMVRSGESACLVSAEFSSENPAVYDALNEIGVDADESLVITRKLTSDGRGSLRLNGEPVSASMLRKVTDLLVDVHGQSEHFFLLKESNQLKMLDSVAGAPVFAEKERVKTLLAQRKKICEDLARLGGGEGERDRRLDILKFQIDEIERASLKEGEEEELKALRERYRNAERILAGLNSARDCLLADGSGLDALRTAQHALSSVSRYEPACNDLSERIETAAEELSDVSDELESLIAALDVDESEAERVENRLDELKALGRKYGGSYQEIMKFYARAKEEYDLLSDSGERFEQLSAELLKTEDALFAACVSLCEARKSCAEGFCKRVTEELKTLNIPSARFEIRFGEFIREDVKNATAEGLGRVCFLFSPNAGEPLKELGKIASGGEMSRFMLAVKAQLTSPDGIGTYIFDEIDAGIGGKTASAVAEKFAKISANVQVIAVTHLARIASFADREFLIEKTEQGERTYTSIREVEGESRVKELARLIGGDSEHVLAHAAELLQSADAYKNSLRK